ncbi:hypothetical protein BGX38DRAFT_1240936, partial [Terfezia claveryi]
MSTEGKLAVSRLTTDCVTLLYSLLLVNEVSGDLFDLLLLYHGMFYVVFSFLMFVLSCAVHVFYWLCSFFWRFY